jgi:1-acyl-sn-glycerol-3-phosphate acyltransferase
MLGCCNFFAKDSIKYVPGFGWGIYLKGSVMLKRKWADDEENIKRTFQKIHENKLPYWLISHPEGHRITKKFLEETNAWGKKNDLPPMRHVLYPRTKGFVESVRGLRGSTINAVYDITIVYENNKYPTLYDLCCGVGTQKVHIHVRRFTFDQLPQDRKELSDWLIKLYQEKDELIEKCHKENGFPGGRKLPYKKLPLKQ